MAVDIDYSRLSLHYQVQCTKEDILYLFKELNLNKKNTCKILKLSRKRFRKYQIQWGIFKSSSFSDPIVQQKARKTIKERYGGNNSTSSPLIKEKIKKTCIQKYNRESSSQIHIPLDKLEILNNCEKFTEYLFNLPYDKRTFHYIAKDLGVVHRQIHIRAEKYNLKSYFNINPLKSSYEIAIHQYILETWGIDFKFHNRNSIKNPYTQRYMELDLYCPKLKLAIEFNSTRYHTEENGKGKEYHILKQKLCTLANIDLLFIWQKDWDKNIDKCKEEIDRFIQTKGEIKMQNNQNDQLNKNQELREIVKEVVREELKDDLEKMKKNHHLKEGYQYLNE